MITVVAQNVAVVEADGVAKVTIDYLVPCGTVTIHHAEADKIINALRQSGATIVDLRSQEALPVI